MLLDRNTASPLYEQLKKVIEHKIKVGELKIDEQLPSERQLCEIYEVSRITVRQAISLAENEGLLYRKHGIGTFVTKPKIQQKLSSVDNFQTTLSQQGLVARTEKWSSEIISCNFQISRLLDIDIMEKVANLRLVGFADDSPIVFYDSYFTYDIGKKMIAAADEALMKNTPFSTLDLHKEISNDFPTHVEQTMEAHVSNEQLSKILRVEKGSPILRVTSIVYCNSKPVEYKETHYRGDKYKFFITRNL
ncbi:GntR family transcriptional regulator [Paenisporosarcina sp. TG-14]|uniref:GntR family transcriptional regulator n=1 Tax=Paenisporosarcina sp. TG-14 TaxID=1231057 RepID=UPI0002F08EF5|nr:GntR family transcriptional regulator [Paenisporosarcina sp. TG-14]